MAYRNQRQRRDGWIVQDLPPGFSKKTDAYQLIPEAIAAASLAWPRAQVGVPASRYSRMAGCRALIRVLTMTTPGRSGATLDSKDPHRPNHRRLTGCHSYRSPDSAGRPAHAGA